MNNNVSIHTNQEVTTLFYTHCNSIESIVFLIHMIPVTILYIRHITDNNIDTGCKCWFCSFTVHLGVVFL